MIDVVYVVRQGDVNEELRYSLRSLANLPHRRVWLVGHRPWWVVNVTHVVVEQTPHKHENTWACWQAIADHDGIGDEFVLFNDDMFVMHPTASVPLLHREPLPDWVRQWAAVGPHGHVRASSTVDLLAQAGVDIHAGAAWELHYPMPAHRPTLAAALAAARHVGDRLPLADHLAKRTWYANLAGLAGSFSEDCKIRSDVEWAAAGGADRIRQWPYLSTDDEPFSAGHVGRYIRRVFPDASPYEFVAHRPTLSRPSEVPVRFASHTYPNLIVDDGRLRFTGAGMPQFAETSSPRLIAVLQSPQWQRRGVRVATDEDLAAARQRQVPEPTPPASAAAMPPAGTPGPETVPPGAASAVLAWVGDDPARARQALEAEQARPKPRSSLLAKLEVAAGDDRPAGEE